MTNNENESALHTLGDRGQTVDGSANDVRGREVKDKDGHGIGKVADLLIDDREDKVRFLLVEHGGFAGFGEKRSLIPVDAVASITADTVLLDQSRERVAAAPGYDPDLVNERPYHAGIYNHYGYNPSWMGGYLYPTGLWGIQLGSRSPVED